MEQNNIKLVSEEMKVKSEMQKWVKTETYGSTSEGKIAAFLLGV